ncbi:hypothetical protein OUZ56_016197 [Daphnia magna]|uniref:Ty3 transposon capsid-like protein domain-containing protein n=1 Tax=Daphnia magna TaxID=35525 RepID=A0ABR0AQ42_9CRUS|nr:hypothetical protein OUZ56_016197 [Daphnia magna]
MQPSLRIIVNDKIELVYWQIHSLETITFGGPNETARITTRLWKKSFCSVLHSPAASIQRFYHQVFKQPTSEHHREQLQESNEALKNSLEKANSRIADLEQNLETTLATESQLQNLLKRKEENNAAVETEGQEIINKLEVKFIETEDSNDSRLDEDEPGEITKLVGDINELTLPTDSGDKSLHYELEIEQTNDFEQTIENLKTQIEHLNKTIIYLEQENQQFKKKVDMGVTHDDEDTSEKTFVNTSKKNTKDGEIPTTEQDDEDAKKVNRYFTQPIVKALGELFSREDKKAIPIFKGKSTDKLISEWLRGAEHVARNNEWDDNQKIRFFSDRLKGEAFEWHENYAEEEGDDLNYQDWKEALITRFQDTYDLATLEKIFQN